MTPTYADPARRPIPVAARHAALSQLTLDAVAIGEGRGEATGGPGHGAPLGGTRSTKLIHASPFPSSKYSTRAFNDHQSPPIRASCGTEADGSPSRSSNAGNPGSERSGSKPGS